MQKEPYDFKTNFGPVVLCWGPYLKEVFRKYQHRGIQQSFISGNLKPEPPKCLKLGEYLASKDGSLLGVILCSQKKVDKIYTKRWKTAYDMFHESKLKNCLLITNM